MIEKLKAMIARNVAAAAFRRPRVITPTVKPLMWRDTGFVSENNRTSSLNSTSPMTAFSDNTVMPNVPGTP